jgi:type IV pilus assembly protein PilC
MARFSFKAITSSGEVYTGRREAEDEHTLARQLKQEGNTLISVEAHDPKRGMRFNISFGRVKLRDKILFARNLSAMISAGLSLSRALSVIERQSRNKKFQKVLRGLQERIQQGKAFSQSLGDFPDVFPPIFVSMVHAGEESGNVAQALESLAIQMDKSYQLKRRVRGAMMYPSIVISVMALVGVAMLIFVVPTLTSTFLELSIELPLSTRIVIGVSDFFKNNLFLALGIIVAFIAGMVLAWRRPKSRRVFEFLLLRIPIVGTLIKETNSARTTRTLASLLVAGVEVVAALGITKDVLQNSYYRNVIAEAETRIQKGSPLSAPFLEHEHLYPVLVGEMMSVGEEAGNLLEMLRRVAEFYEDEVEQKTRDMSTVIEPFLMVLIGAVVGFFALSMISPIYSISSGI